MTWYDSNYKQRQPIAIDALAGDGTVQPKDITLTIPKTWDIFWQNIRTDAGYEFFDVIPVDVEGNLLTFKRASENLATRTLVLEIDNHNVKTQAINQIFLYFQNPDQSSDLASSFTASSAIDAYIDISQAGGFIVRQPLNRPPTQSPLQAITKSTTDVIDVFFSVAGLFRSMSSPYANRADYEGISYITVQSLDSSGVDSSARYEEGDTRIIDGFVKARAKAGSDGADYALVVTVATSTDQIIDIRCLVQVRDQLPAS